MQALLLTFTYTLFEVILNNNVLPIEFQYRMYSTLNLLLGGDNTEQTFGDYNAPLCYLRMFEWFL